MIRSLPWRWFALALLLAGPASAQTLLFDFGGANTTSTGPAPDDPVNAWNNITGGIGTAAPGTPAAELLDAVDTSGAATAIDLVMLARFNGVNENGTQVSGAFPTDATRDSMFGNTETFGAGADFYPSFKLTGLNPTASYNLSFYASRTGVGDNRQTQYTVNASTEVVVTLDPANNEDATVTAPLLKPTAAGEITVTLAPGPDNSNGNHFTYLGILKVEVVPVQQPVVFTTQPADYTIPLGRPVTFTSAVNSTPPYTIQWRKDGVDIPGATQFSYTIPAVTADLDNTRYSVKVSNLEFNATSREAVLRVSTDITPPTLTSAVSGGPWLVLVTFSEEVEEASAIELTNYVLDDGDRYASAATLLPDRKTVQITPDGALSGTFNLEISNVRDLATNPVPANTQAQVEVLQPDGKSILIDFGGDTTEQGGGNDDPLNYWNNLSAGIAGTDGGILPELLFNDGELSPVSLTVVSRFNGVNTAGTQAPAPFPVDATRDTLYGNTELFGTLENVFPVVAFTGLDPARTYDFTLYASRMDAGDNRETRYTFKGASEAFADLNVSNNIQNSINMAGVRPDAAGEISIALTPGPNNNNANHFTYLGVVKIVPQGVAAGPPAILPPALTGGNFVVSWNGTGILESATNPAGPWTAITPAPTSPYSEPVVPGGRKFFRVRP